jgi:ankyrin repeat protein
VLELLLKGKADPSAAQTDDGQTPLFIAAANGYASVIKLLLEYKVSVWWFC